MDFFQCLGVELLLPGVGGRAELLMTRERGSLCSGGEGREATLPGEMEEASESRKETFRKKFACRY